MTNYYDGCLLRDTLVAIEDKDAFLEIVLAAVKPGKPIAITESFITAAEPGPLASASIDGEPAIVFPCEASLVIDKLEASNFDVRVNADETAQYTALACTAWVEMADKITPKSSMAISLMPSCAKLNSGTAETRFMWPESSK